MTALTPGEDAVIPLRLARLNSNGNDGDIRDGLRALTTTHAGEAAVWFEYAAAEWALADDKRDLAAVRTALDRALALKPDHVRANVLLGELLMYDLDKKGDYEEASWERAREPVQLASRTDPNDPLPLYIHYQSFMAEGKFPSPDATKGLEKAFRLAPENIELRVAYAFSLANHGQFGSAIILAQSIAFDPHMGAQARPLLEQLMRMRNESRGIVEGPPAEKPD